MSSLLIRNIGLLATPTGSAAKSGAEQGSITLLRDAWVLTENERILSVGTGEPDLSAGMHALMPPRSADVSDPRAERSGDRSLRVDSVIDAGGCLVTPGLVDAHTHLVFGGWRQHELALKLKNVPYLEILAQGGGIHSTVRKSTEASEQALTEKAAAALDEMLRLGTTSCEAKSGYGLSTQEELKQLRVIRSLNGSQPVELVPTFLGAHALPQAYAERREDYIRLLCEEMIPAVAEAGLAEFCDVFCETGVFTAREAETILRAGLQYGLRPKIHADELDAIGGSQLAGRLGAISAEHLIVCPEDGIESLAKGGTVACLLPATSFYLNAGFAPARRMIEAGVPVALATDYNPGTCPCLNLQLVINLGCLKYRMTPEEVLTSVTLNAAAAVGRAERLGSVEEGKQADLVLWNAPDLDYLCYRLGSNLVRSVVKRGRVVV